MVKQANKFIKHAQSLSRKIAGSKAADLLQNESAGIEEMLAVAAACVNFFGLLASTTKPPDPAEFLENLAVLHEAGAHVSSNLLLLEFQNKLQHALTLNDVSAACQMCLRGSTELRRLCQSGCSIEAATSVATSSILDSAVGQFGVEQTGATTAENEPDEICYSCIDCNCERAREELGVHCQHDC